MDGSNLACTVKPDDVCRVKSVRCIPRAAMRKNDRRAPFAGRPVASRPRIRDKKVGRVKYASG